MCIGGRIHGRPCQGCPPVGPGHRILPSKVPSPSPSAVGASSQITALPPEPVSVPILRKPDEVIQVPLTGVQTNVRILDFTAEITIIQRFENVEDTPIEAVYEFPLQANAAVCAFRAEIDGVIVEGAIKEKEKAKQIYDDAISSGHGAYMLEQDKTNLFTASVGNLPAGKAVLLTITYVHELEFDEGKLKFVLPTQSYAPNGRDVPKFTAPKNQSYVKEVPYGLRVAIELDMTSNIRSVASSTHPIAFEFGDVPTRAVVRLQQLEGGVPLTKNFEMLTTLADSHRPVARIETDANGRNAAMLALHPKLDEEGDIFTEMVFVLDRSGSMAGSRINKVKDTLQLFLRSLPEGTMFQIYGFGTRFEKLFPAGSAEYNEATLHTATQYADKLSANMGGTNILSPLMDILQSPSKPGVPRQVFLLTDGEVGNTAECISAVRKHASTTRLFTFGIGDEASVALVQGMADAGEGKAEFIRSGDNFEEKVMRQLQRALKPAFTDISVDWGAQSGNIQQSPYRLPPLFSGGRMIIYGLLPPDFKAGPVTLKAQTAKGPFSLAVDVDPSKAVKGALVQRLAARSLIRDVQENRSYMHDEKGALLPKYRADDVEKEIVSLSIRTGVVSPYTAFVAVEKRADATEGEMKLRKIEVSKVDAKSNRSTSPRSSSSSSTVSNSGSVALSSQASYGGGGGGARGGRGSADGSRRLSGGRVTSGPGSAPSEPAVQRRKSGSGGGVIGGILSAITGGGSNSAPPPPPAASGAPPSPSLSLNSSEMLAARPSATKSRVSPREEEKEKKSELREGSSEGKKKFKSRDKDSSPRNKSESSSRDSSQDDEMSAPSAPMKLSAPMAPAPAPMSSVAAESRFQQQAGSMAGPLSAASAAASASVAASGPKDSSGLRDIIRQQSANGGFSLDCLRSLVPSATQEKVSAALSAAGLPAGASVLLLTIAVCLYIERHFADQKVNWDLSVKKARRWVKKEQATQGVKEDFDWDSVAAKLLA